MSQRVDFYLLNRHLSDGRLRVACRLAQKIYKLGHRAYILTRDEREARQLDDLLWTFDQGSFVPHHRASPEPGGEESPIAIGHEPPGSDGGNVLISLIEATPACFEDFERIADVVDDLDEEKAKARERFRFYRDLGCRLDTHDIVP